jgi:hypothetical protein
MDRTDAGVAELWVSDHVQMGSLVDYLHLSVPGLQVTRSPGRAGPGEQGALDVLLLAADSSVLVAVVNVLPQFLRSRKTATTVTMTVRGKRLTVTADNAEEVTSIVERFLES